MGYMRHHAIIVTSWDNEAIEKAYEVANSIDGLPKLTTPILPSIINGYFTFAIFPDGSKEGWEASDQGDEMRDLIIVYLEKQIHEDGSSNLDWVEVQYGDDNGDNRVTRSSR